MYWQLAKNYKLDISKALLMGILNVTPDSFSDGGCYCNLEASCAHALNLHEAGAHLIDIGGESTRPGAQAIDSALEQKRILPVLKKLGADKRHILSVDTYNADTAAVALEHGAHIINDVCGLQRDPAMAEIIAQYKAGIIIMHTNRDRQSLPDIIDDQKYFFEKSLDIAYKAGIKEDSIALDPGFGFGKDALHNMALFKRIGELISFFSYPFVAATSRKRFLGTIAAIEKSEKRDVVTASTSLLLRQKGFSIFRVHNVAYTKQALAIYEALGT